MDRWMDEWMHECMEPNHSTNNFICFLWCFILLHFIPMWAMKQVPWYLSITENEEAGAQRGHMSSPRRENNHYQKYLEDSSY